MLGWLFKKLQSLQMNKTRDRENSWSSKDALHSKLERNLAKIQEVLGESPDLKIRKFSFKAGKTWEAALVFIDGLVDTKVIEDHILRPLMVNNFNPGNGSGRPHQNRLTWIGEHLITVNSLAYNHTFDEVQNAILTGDTVLLVDDFDEGLQISSKGWEKRGIQEPDTEVNIKGAREGFIENLRTNTALLRRKVRHPNLTFEAMIVGRKTKTSISLAYIRGVAREDLVAEVSRRIRRIDTDAILDAGILEQYIEDAPFSPFPTVNYTERPEVAAARILEGRVAIMVDGTPIVNTVPMLFLENFQTPDDYNYRWLFATLLRWIRFLTYGLSITLPAFYVAFTTYHQELIPTPLLISIAASEEGTPYPAVVEVVLMGVIFEILREAGIRLPRPIGTTVSIVGALVIGQTAVSAGLIGAPVVIIIALTAIASFVVPFQVESATLIRLGLVLPTGFLGLIGVVNGLILILIHLASLRSFGVHYLSPVAPMITTDLKDTVIRAPLWTLLTRPRSLEPQDVVRQKAGLDPKPPGREKR